MMKKKILLVLGIALVVMSGCSNNSDKKTAGQSDTVREEQNNENKEKKEAPLSNWKPEKVDPEDRSIEHVGEMKNFGDVIENKFEETGTDYDIIVNQAYITDTLEEDVSEWSEVALREAQVSFTDGKLDNGRKLIYIQSQITNHSEDTLDYDAGQVKLVFEKDGTILNAGSELGYAQNREKGKQMNFVKIESGASETLKTGFIVLEGRENCPLYLEVSGATGIENYILIPLDEVITK